MELIIIEANQALLQVNNKAKYMKLNKKVLKKVVSEELSEMFSVSEADRPLELRGPMVMQSGGGYYVGYESKDYMDDPDIVAPEDDPGFWVPHDRVTAYYSTREEADMALEKVKAHDLKTQSVIPGHSGDYIGPEGPVHEVEEEDPAAEEAKEKLLGDLLLKMQNAFKAGQLETMFGLTRQVTALAPKED